jgi:hypothetical protein
MGAHLAERLAVQRDRAARGRMHPGHGFQEAGLADAIGAHDAGDLAGLRLQIDAVKDLRAAIMQGEVFQRSAYLAA